VSLYECDGNAIADLIRVDGMARISLARIDGLGPLPTIPMPYAYFGFESEITSSLVSDTELG